jgi:hypothetical protein
MEKNPTLNEMFPLPSEASNLQVFVGDWSGEGTLTLEGKRLKVKGSWKFTSAAAGWGVLNESKVEIEGLGMYEEVDILGFDPGEKMFHLFSVTNTAATHDHKGKWLEDSTISFVCEGLQEGKAYREKVEVKILGPKEFTIHEKDYLDGKPFSAMEVTLRKKRAS